MTEVKIPDDAELVRRVIADEFVEEGFPLWRAVCTEFNLWDYEADRPDEDMGRAVCLKHGFDPDATRKGG